MSLDLTGDKSTLVQVMAWCHQVPNHQLNVDSDLRLHITSLGHNELRKRKWHHILTISNDADVWHIAPCMSSSVCYAHIHWVTSVWFLCPRSMLYHKLMIKFCQIWQIKMSGKQHQQSLTIYFYLCTAFSLHQWTETHTLLYVIFGNILLIFLIQKLLLREAQILWWT